MGNNKGLVFGIQHFSIHDGPGIRSTVFLKGCPLRCKWCHNPEGLPCSLGIQYYQRDCKRCGACKHAYKNLKELSQTDEETKREIAEHCPYHAFKLVGEYMTVDEIMKLVVKDKNYFTASNGGITISGGEPMMQAKFAIEIAKAAKENSISTALETSGFGNLRDYEAILPYVDTFLFDYKATGDQMYKDLTGVSDELIKSNFKYLYSKGANIVLRCPLIPKINDTDEHLNGIAQMYKDYPNLKGIEIMPYHKMGVSKAKRVGVDQKEYGVPNKELKKVWEAKIESFGGKITKMN